jgi:hypothetical protein
MKEILDKTESDDEWKNAYTGRGGIPNERCNPFTPDASVSLSYQEGSEHNDLQNNVGSSEAEQIIPQTPLKKKIGTEELEKVSNENKSNDDSTVNNSVAANESSNVIHPVAGITVTTNAMISTDTGTEEFEKVSNENKSKDDSTVNNPVVANESSNVTRPDADIRVNTNAAISTDAATTASATMLTMVAAPTTAGAVASQSEFCAAGAVCTHSQGPADLSGLILESITDAMVTTANEDNGGTVDGKDGNGINDQQQISDAENGRETFNNNEIGYNYEENDVKEMGDKNNKSDDNEEKNDDTDEKEKSHQDQISPDIIRPFFPNFTRNFPKPSFKKYLQTMPHNLKALLPPQIKIKEEKKVLIKN